jgi:IS30 family transposase
LKRNPSTISRELKRNVPRGISCSRLSALERASLANEQSQRRQRDRDLRCRNLFEKRPDIERRVLILLKESNYSPENIADILSQSDLGIKVSGRTIRRRIEKMYPDYRKHFPHRGKRPRKHLTPKRSRVLKKGAPEKRSVHDRVCDRSTVGSLELDLIVSKKSKTVILVIRDRKTRKVWLRLINSKEAGEVRRAIINVLSTIPPLMLKSCTFDRGTEFSEVNQLEKLYDVVNYFCDAYAAYQKGTVEQGNKELRRYIPKGTDLSTITEEELKGYEDLLNAKPRNCIGKLSSDDLWEIEAHQMRSTLH